MDKTLETDLVIKRITGTDLKIEQTTDGQTLQQRLQQSRRDPTGEEEKEKISLTPQMDPVEVAGVL